MTTEPMIELHTLDDVVLKPDDPRIGRRTRKAEETIEVAFMYVCFAELGAPVDRHLLGWARQILWSNCA